MKPRIEIDEVTKYYGDTLVPGQCQPVGRPA